MSNFPYTPSKKSTEEKEKRDLLLRQLRDEKITFDQIVELSNTQEFSVINGTSVAVIVGSLPGWDRESVRRALISYGLQSNATLRGAKKNEAHIDIIRHLCNSTSTQWQKRVAAPKGWPWFGNVIATLEKLDEGDLPREISESTRFLTDYEKKNADDPYDTEAESDTVTSTSETEADDSLDDLFNFSDDDDGAESGSFESEDDGDSDDDDDNFLANLLG